MNHRREAREEALGQPVSAPPPLLLNPALEAQGAYPLLRLDERRQEVAERGVVLFDFGTGDPREPTSPKIRQALLDGVPRVSRYPSAAGKGELREAFCGWMLRRHGVDLDPETEVLPATGSKEAIFHAPLAFLHPSHERRGVAYGTPGYPVYERGTVFAGGEALPVRLRSRDGYLLRPDDIDPERTRAVWINYPHNPTGATASRSYLEEMAGFCREHDLLLFSDECYNDVYSGRPAAVDPGGRQGSHPGLRLALQAQRHDRLPRRDDGRRPRARGRPQEAPPVRRRRDPGLCPGRGDRRLARRRPRRRAATDLRRETGAVRGLLRAHGASSTCPRTPASTCG